MTDSSRTPVARALISVSDKSGLLEQAKALAAHGVALVSTGGTYQALAAAGLEVTEVASLTGFPEMMDGRVKTLHPAIHGGLLGRRDNAEDMAAMRAHAIPAIDLLYVNLYPFEATVAAGEAFAACVENIDVGGPAMLRAAAKNHAFVAVCTEPEDLAAVLAELAEGGVTAALRRRLAAKTFARTAAYDAAIATWFAGQIGEPFPAFTAIGGARRLALRYGENPHQQAAFYATGERRFGVATARQIQGKDLSYNNLNDTDAAYELVAEFPPEAAAAVAIIKHANPCGVALGADLREAYERALACDPVSAFGGIVAVNRRLDRAAAERIVDIFTEVVIAPDADEDAVAVFAAKKNLRLLLAGGVPDPAAPGFTARTLAGGLLLQTRDAARIHASDLHVATKRAPSAQELEDLLFAFTVAKHVKSNAVVYAKHGRTVGVGAGQMNRKDSARIAALRGREALGAEFEGAVCASDAFFPFADGLIQAAEAGVTAVIQPGGSIRDAEVIEAANARGLAMVFTGVRVFRH